MNPDSSPATFVPSAYEWPQGKSSAFCFSVDVDAESPYQWNLPTDAPQTLGQIEQRLFGPRIGIWRILDLLDRYGIKATMFVPGLVARNHPDLLPAFVARGHEVGLHGYFHELATEAGPEEFARALDESLALFKSQAGIVPKGFRSPAWEMTPFMLAEVKRRGLYDSSLMGFDHPYTIDGVTQVPVLWAVDDAIYFRFSGSPTDRAPPSPQGGILEAWLDEWHVLHREGRMMMLTIHDWISGRAGRIRMLEKLLDVVATSPGTWIATVGEVAAHHAASANAERFSVPLRLPEASGPHRFKAPR
ncbi:MAG TPA: polysaccharide deacetylase [Bosea sp. (in: a-proteobacteria)]|jgi:peptidoglycan/xylan/chitin deacetylase (PgdA/CDA1 family)|uniref:polysaccharide deacetylase family protein n=1 Tax=Bosea sp. (in: a-proteobacteria) TaxID=1871050 RepID=UPI002E120B12|nr:polysaccharide deacetylase [Bosea sp. (in: a-proteobacteria)]